MGRRLLELRPSPEFLADPQTVYPVTVDPDISLTPGFDTYVTDEHPYDAFASDWSLRVGSNDGTNRNRSVISFPTGAIAGQTVTKATLRLFQYGAGNCDPRRVDALIRTTGWSVPDFYEQLINGVSKHSWVAQGATVAPDSRFASSDSFNASAAGGGTPNCGGPSWQTIDLTPQTSAWAGLIQEDFGVMLKTPENRERNTNFEKRFCAENPNNTGSGYCQNDRKPELQITYTPELGDQSWYSTSKHKLDERSTLKVNHRSGNTYISANDASVSSLGMDLTLARRYNSRAGTPGQFGPKWTLSGGPDVWLEKIDQWRYVYHTPDGAELGPFVRNADTEPEDGYDKFTTPVGGLGADLKDNTNDTFTLTFHKSQKKYTFTAMGGDGDLFHTKTADRSGNTTTYDYVSGTQRLDSVTDTAGRAYQISYATSGSAAGMIDQISDANGPTTRTWSYGYTDGRLTSYTDPEGDTTSYAWGLGSTEATEPGPEGRGDRDHHRPAQRLGVLARGDAGDRGRRDHDHRLRRRTRQ